jgi:hypothetical protein
MDYHHFHSIQKLKEKGGQQLVVSRRQFPQNLDKILIKKSKIKYSYFLYFLTKLLKFTTRRKYEIVV